MIDSLEVHLNWALPLLSFTLEGKVAVMHGLVLTDLPGTSASGRCELRPTHDANSDGCHRNEIQHGTGGLFRSPSVGTAASAL
jgi:hypothetical protein